MSDQTTTNDLQANLRASRMRVSRSRGAASGVLVVILGAWAALIPFVGPYFDFAFTPQPDASWHWTSGRGLYELLPGGVAALGGLLLLASANRVVASFGGWLGVAGGAWLVVAPSLAGPIGVDIGSPDPSKGETTRALAGLLYFYAIGAALVLFAALALGRLSVHAVRDVRAAEKRAEAEAAAVEAEQVRVERELEERRRIDAQRSAQAERDARAVHEASADRTGPAAHQGTGAEPQDVGRSAADSRAEDARGVHRVDSPAQAPDQGGYRGPDQGGYRASEQGTEQSYDRGPGQGSEQSYDRRPDQGADQPYGTGDPQRGEAPTGAPWTRPAADQGAGHPSDAPPPDQPFRQRPRE